MPVVGFASFVRLVHLSGPETQARLLQGLDTFSGVEVDFMMVEFIN
jgi:hypothetical protein